MPHNHAMAPGEFFGMFVVCMAILGLFRWLFDGTGFRFDMQEARMENMAKRLTWVEDRAVLEVREEDLLPELPRGKNWPNGWRTAIKRPAWKPWEI